MRIILASKSPRRREILSDLGVDFQVLSADADETSGITDPAALVKELSLRKGRAVRALLQASDDWDDHTLILASDTVVSSAAGILGKPKDENDAARMLRVLSGSHHQVISGVAVFLGKQELCDADSTTVRFSDLSEREIFDYIKSGEPNDKAGAYAIQGLASLFIEGIEGDYFNVVGLPVFRLNRLIRTLTGRNITELNEN